VLIDVSDPGRRLTRNNPLRESVCSEAPLTVEGTKLLCKVISLKRLSQIQKAKRKKSQYSMPHRQMLQQRKVFPHRKMTTYIQMMIY
jgi:hypothetical protein